MTGSSKSQGYNQDKLIEELDKAEASLQDQLVKLRAARAALAAPTADYVHRPGR